MPRAILRRRPLRAGSVALSVICWVLSASTRCAIFRGTACFSAASWPSCSTSASSTSTTIATSQRGDTGNLQRLSRRLHGLLFLDRLLHRAEDIALRRRRSFGRRDQPSRQAGIGIFRRRRRADDRHARSRLSVFVLARRCRTDRHRHRCHFLSAFRACCTATAIGLCTVPAPEFDARRHPVGHHAIGGDLLRRRAAAGQRPLPAGRPRLLPALFAILHHGDRQPQYLAERLLVPVLLLEGPGIDVPGHAAHRSAGAVAGHLLLCRRDGIGAVFAGAALLPARPCGRG